MWSRKEKPKPPKMRVFKEGEEGDMDKVTREDIGAAAKKDKVEDKTITEKIPKNLLQAIDEAKNKVSNLSNQLNQMNIGILRAQKQQKLFYDKLENASINFTNKIEFVSQKMKLAKKRQYKNWRYDGKDGFVGEKIQNEEENKRKKN